jgi:predicted nucleic acid-binding protein
VLLKAKRDGEILSLKIEIDRLVQNAGFFVSDRVRNAFLAEAGEAL